MQPVNDLAFVIEDGAKALPVITQKKIALLEKSACIQSDEKVRLLALLAHKRWLTEIGVQRSKETHDQPHFLLLEELELAWKRLSYIKKDGTTVSWIEVGANRAVVEYISQNRDTLSVLEAGTLYGYPVTAALACSGLIKAKHKKIANRTVAERCLGGIYSADFVSAESHFFESMWGDLGKISPRIIAEASA